MHVELMMSIFVRMSNVKSRPAACSHSHDVIARVPSCSKFNFISLLVIKVLNDVCGGGRVGGECKAGNLS